MAVRDLTEKELKIADSLKHLVQARFLNDSHYRAGFIAGLSHNQAKLDSECQERIAYNKLVSDKLTKLINYAKGEIPRSGIEGIIE